MCDFEPGDEVVCVKSKHGREGKIFTVAAVRRVGDTITIRDLSTNVKHPAIQLEELPWVETVETNDAQIRLVWGYDATAFRKVQRRDLSAWLKTAVGNTDRLDKRAPAKEGAA